jgi:hypothetical protein
MLYKETTTIYCENHLKHTNTFCGQNAEFYYVKAGGTYGTTGLKGLRVHYCSVLALALVLSSLWHLEF